MHVLISTDSTCSIPLIDKNNQTLLVKFIMVTLTACTWECVEFDWEILRLEMNGQSPHVYRALIIPLSGRQSEGQELSRWGCTHAMLFKSSYYGGC